jgi:hypothetical protein
MKLIMNNSTVNIRKYLDGLFYIILNSNKLIWVRLVDTTIK